MIKWVLLISRQGKTRLSKWYDAYAQKDKMKIAREVTQMVLERPSKLCNFLEWKDGKIVYKRYASLYFVTFIEKTDNELLTLEIVHHFVEVLDRYFGNVCELDLIFGFQKAWYILDEVLIAGELQETSKKAILRAVASQDAIVEEAKKGKKTGGSGGAASKLASFG